MLSENLSRLGRALAAGVVAVAAVAAAGPAAIRGALEPAAADAPLRFVGAAGEAVELVADESLERTLRDPRLATRTWELRGQILEDGRFSVERIFTVKDGELHRVTYYCVICHITTHEPGRCMCCQGDTDLRELPGE